MILTPAELIARCEECVRTWDPSRTTVDSHIEEYVTRTRISDPDDERFVQQVVYGTFRYKKMLKIFLSSLYFKHGGETQRNDYTLYMVFAYLALLRLHELGFPDFRQLVLSQEHFKMSVLLKFMFSAESLNEWLRPEWIKLYEPKFVDEQLIEKVLVFVPNVEALQKVLEGQMAAEAAKKEAAAEAARALAEGRGGGGKHTTPEPFALTQPKMRLVPPPEELIEPFKAGSVPTSTYTDPKELVDRVELDKKKDANRFSMKAKYSNPRVQPFKLRVLERPRAGESHLTRVREEVEAAREAECQFEGVKANPVPRQRPGAPPSPFCTGATRPTRPRPPLPPHCPPHCPPTAPHTAPTLPPMRRSLTHRRRPRVHRESRPGCGPAQLGGDPARRQPLPQEAGERGGHPRSVRARAARLGRVRRVAGEDARPR